jgi:hypothetical protein
MASTLDIDPGTTDTGTTDPGTTDPGTAEAATTDAATTTPRRLSRALRTYAFLVAVVLGLLRGVGLRVVPATAAATPDDTAGPASTACAAQ